VTTSVIRAHVGSEAVKPLISLGNGVQILWALCVYLEAVSVLPQLRMMQNAKVVEKFTAHYVFALGLSRFISCAHWVLQVGTLLRGVSSWMELGETAAPNFHICNQHPRTLVRLAGRVHL